MTKPARYLRKADIAHLVRGRDRVTGRDTFVIVGTGAVIVQLKTVPLDLMRTREIDRIRAVSQAWNRESNFM